ncbi:MAG TPA: hypothetical protein VLH79_08575 [Chthonomonadales bacterium]|nr:hypothetical protein [Chthonomonadales bacterium]
MREDDGRRGVVQRATTTAPLHLGVRQPARARHVEQDRQPHPLGYRNLYRPDHVLHALVALVDAVPVQERPAAGVRGLHDLPIQLAWRA